jgi:hypothetical protein
MQVRDAQKRVNCFFHSMRAGKITPSATLWISLHLRGTKRRIGHGKPYGNLSMTRKSMNVRQSTYYGFS